MAESQFVGFTEIVKLFGVAESTVARYIRRPDFPLPVEQLARGSVWRRKDVQEWGRLNLPLPIGRPTRPRRSGRDARGSGRG